MQLVVIHIECDVDFYEKVVWQSDYVERIISKVCVKRKITMMIMVIVS